MSLEALGQCIEEALERLLDRDGEQFNPQRVALLLRQVVGQAGGVARGHPHRRDVASAQRIDRQRQHDRRVDAPRQPQPHLAEAVLAAVVADPAHHRAPGQRVHALVAVVHPQHRREPAPGDVVVHHQPLVGERGRGRVHRAVGIGHQRGAVEHQRILPAHDIEVGHRGAALARALRQHRVAPGVLAAFERRGVGDQHQLGTGAHRIGHRFREPRVLAHQHPDRHALDLEHAALAVRVDVEIAALVEHVVVGQLALAVGGLDPPSAQHAGGVVEDAAVALRPTDHGDDPGGGLRHFAHRPVAVGQERGPHQQVLRRIAADRKLREQHDVGAVLVARLGDHRRDARGIARHVADREVELGHGDAEGVGHWVPCFGVTMRASIACRGVRVEAWGSRPRLQMAVSRPRPHPGPPPQAGEGVRMWRVRCGAQRSLGPRPCRRGREYECGGCDAARKEASAPFPAGGGESTNAAGAMRCAGSFSSVPCRRGREYECGGCDAERKKLQLPPPLAGEGWGGGPGASRARITSHTASGCASTSWFQKRSTW